MTSAFKLLSTLLFALTSILAFEAAAQFQGMRPKGIRGSIGFGLAEYTIHSPNNKNMRIDDGLLTTIAGEAPLNDGSLLAAVSLHYLKGDGLTNYSYSTLQQDYAASDVSFDSTAFTIGLGLKFKPIPAMISPYIEGGGLIGYHELKYTRGLEGLNAVGDNYDTKDSLTETGFYGDIGVEVTFSEYFGVNVGYRLHMMTTRPFDTLGREKIRYDLGMLHFGVMTQF